MEERTKKQRPGVRLLIVDDTPANVRLLVRMLRKTGYAVDTAHNGATALSYAASTPPDLILLDIMMPGMDGYEVCERLKGDAQTRDIPVIFVSALDEPVDKVRAFAVGGVDYVTKPIQVPVVLARIKTHLALRALQKALEHKNAALEQEVVERRRAEQELNQYRAHLEQLVSARTAELQKEVSERQHAEVRLGEQLQFESLVASLSARFINLPVDQVDDEITHSLEQITKHLHVDQGLLLKFEADTVDLYVTHTYTVDGARASPLVPTVEVRFPWYTGTLSQGTVVRIASPDDFPEAAQDEKAYAIKMGIHAALSVPLMVGGTIRYVIVLLCSCTEQTWSAEVVRQTQIIGEILANALERKRMEIELRGYTESLEQLVEEKVDELEMARAKMIQTAKLAALGEMATGVAHELNQPLTAILFEADYLKTLARRALDNGAPALSVDTEEIYQIGHNLAQDIARARRVTDYLRSFKNMATAATLIDINQPIENSFILTSARLSQHDIVVERCLSPDLPQVLANAHKLEQVFLNLINNAEYALIEMDRRITAGESVRAGYQKTLGIRTYLAQHVIVAEVSDNGCGIPQEDQASIFEFFFTTKPESEGSGLSLSISRGIVEEVGGEITFESVENTGTTFTLRFPAAEGGV